MKYIRKDLGSYNLHIIKTKKFKSVVVQVALRTPIIKEEITMRNVLSDMLLLSSEKYPTKREIALKSQDLYASSIMVEDLRLGNYINTNFYLSTLNDKYTEEGNLKEGIIFLSELINHPRVVDNHFYEEDLEIIKRQATASLERIKEDPANYSLIRLFENMDKDSPLSYSPMGYIEDLEKINTSNLYIYYKNMMKINMMDILVIGDVKEEEIENMITENFQSNTYKKARKPYRLEEKKLRSKKMIVKEKEDLTQAKLSIGCRLYELTEEERNYSLTLYSIILGIGGDSKLFKNIREKHSVAYYINATPNKLDNVLTIRAGITKENLKKVVKLIEAELQAMKKGDFTEEDLDKAKELFNTSLDELEESPSRIMNAYYMMELLGIDDIKTRREKMNKVLKEDIVSVAKKIKIDTVYCLEGE